MLWTKQILNEVMSSKLSLSYVWGEILELKDEVVAGNATEALKEWEDVTGCALVWLTGRTGLNFPLLPFFGKGAAERWKERLSMWETIFKLHNVEFHRRYLGGGGNYRKKSKIKKALDVAGYKAQIDWELLACLAIDFEDE